MHAHLAPAHELVVGLRGQEGGEGERGPGGREGSTASLASLEGAGGSALRRLRVGALQDRSAQGRVAVRNETPVSGPKLAKDCCPILAGIPTEHHMGSVTAQSQPLAEKDKDARFRQSPVRLL